MTTLNYPLPPELDNVGYVRARATVIVPDGASDEDRRPDLVGGVGTITFTPQSLMHTVLTPVPSWVGQKAVTFKLATKAEADASEGAILAGEMVDSNGALGAYLVAGTWRVTIAIPGVSVKPYDITIKSTHTEDNPLHLSVFEPVTPGEGVVVNVLEVPSGQLPGQFLGWGAGHLQWQDLVFPTANEIVGAGRPDVPASMTSAVQALVAAATSGAEFRSLDGPQGAWEWRKRGTGWVVTDGDTGWVTIPITAVGVTVPAGAPGVKVRRVRERVEVSIDRISFLADFASGTPVIPLAPGFNTAKAEFLPRGASYDGGQKAAIAGTSVVFYGATALADFRATYSWHGTTAWPLTLTL